MNYKQTKKNKGRPKINWGMLSYDDYDLDQLDKEMKSKGASELSALKLNKEI